MYVCVCVCACVLVTYPQEENTISHVHYFTLSTISLCVLSNRFFVITNIFAGMHIQISHILLQQFHAQIPQNLQAKRLNFTHYILYFFHFSFFCPSVFPFPVEWCYLLWNLQYTIFCKYSAYLSTSLYNLLLVWTELNAVEWFWFLPSSFSRRCVLRLCFSLLDMAVCTVVSAMEFTDVIILISTNTFCVSPSLSFLLGVLGVFKHYTSIPLKKQLR